MTVQMYTVFDSAIGAYNAPFTARNDLHAKRILEHETKRAGSDIGKKPTDYTLFHIGEFDEDTGQIRPVMPTQIARAQDLITE